MDLVFKDLSEKIIKASFNIYNALGYGYQEKEYQKAFALELEKNGLKYKREVYSDLLYEGVKIRGFYLDFIIEQGTPQDSVVVELKVANRPYQKHFFQVFQYLKNHNLKLGLILVFSPTGVIVKRVVNLK